MRVILFLFFWTLLRSLNIPLWGQVKVYTSSGIATAANEVAWRVRIETLQNLPIDRYNKLPPSIRDMLYVVGINTSEIAVYAGDYYNSNDVEETLKQLRAMGYKEAFVVRFNLQDKIGGEEIRKVEPVEMHNMSIQPIPSDSEIGQNRGIFTNSGSNVNATEEQHLATTPVSFAEPKDDIRKKVEEIMNAPDMTTTINGNMDSAAAGGAPATFGVPIGKGDVKEIYFVQLGLFEWTNHISKYQELTYLNHILGRQVIWQDKSVTQIVVGPFNDLASVRVAQEEITRRGFDNYIKSITYYRNQLEFLSNDPKRFMQFEYLLKKKP